MKRRVYNCIRDAAELRQLVEDRKASYMPTGWRIWDNWFGGFQRGTIQVIAAPTGHGKTTMLIAMAKLAARKHYRILYIGTEQEEDDIFQYFDDKYDIDIVRKHSMDTWPDVIGDAEYDLIIYDYFAADSMHGEGEWGTLIHDMNTLADYAIDHHLCILTAMQADNSITRNPKEEWLHEGGYLSFSKHVTDKMWAGVYIRQINDDILNDNVMISMFKVRNKPKDDTSRTFKMDYRSKEIII